MEIVSYKPFNSKAKPNKSLGKRRYAAYILTSTGEPRAIDLGEAEKGEGIYSFRRALVIAGSESQVISLWKVADDVTKDLMVAYYQKVLGENGKKQGRSEALRQVQLEMLRGNKYQHPYFWAAFIASGDWRAMGSTLARE